MFLKSSSGGRRCSPRSRDSARAPTDYDIRVENRKTGAGVRRRAIGRSSKLLFWSAGQDGLPRAVHRRQRRAGEGIDLDDSLQVLRSEEELQKLPTSNSQPPKLPSLSSLGVGSWKLGVNH